MLDSIDILVGEIKKKLGKLYPSISAGPDCHYPRVLKELQEELAGPLQIVFQKSLEEGYLQQS